MKKGYRVTALAVFFSMFLFAGCAPENEELLVVGSWSSLRLYRDYEKPYWTKTLQEVSNNHLKVNMTTHDQMGVAGGDVFRLLGEGVFDIGMTVANYAVADAPELEGVDVPLVALDAKAAQAAVTAARPMLDDIFRDRFNAKVLAVAPYTPQIVFCKDKISSLSDLKGKKIRGSGRMVTKLLSALGAVGVNVAFSEIPGALERGVLDCAVAGSGSGYSSSWWEVSHYLLPLPLGGWAPVVTAINLDKWNSLSDTEQNYITSSIKSRFEDPAWKGTGEEFDADIVCLTGTGECPLGKSGDMVLVQSSDSDFQLAKDILLSTVLPEWRDRAGKDWVSRWNDSVGKVVGISVPIN